VKTLEEHIIAHPDSGQIWQDIRHAFSDDAGQRVLAMLSAFRHPYSSAMLDRKEADPCVTAFISGQKDIISTLARFALEAGGQASFNPHSVAKTDAVL
jgi:hypothetical protein